ncbi:MAG: NAD(P)-dependent oxidoreductase [Patescibacteria group bacterium]
MKNKKYQNILVTGGAGCVGSTLVPLLLKAGYKVRVLDNLMYGGMGLLTNFSNPNFEVIIGDIRNKTVVTSALKNMHAIIHLAAIVGYPACDKYPREAQEINYQATKQLNELRGKNQLLIFASTGSNYGHVESGMCTEETPLAPLTNYGRSKTKAEEAIVTSPNVIIYRFATAFGLSPRLRLDLFINDLTYQALKTKHLVIYEKDYRRTFIHVKDMAKSFIFALENSSKMIGQTYNVGDESMNLKKEDIVNILLQKLEFILNFTDSGRDADQRNYAVDYSKIKKLGFKTDISIENGTDEMINAFKVVTIKNPYSNY